MARRKRRRSRLRGTLRLVLAAAVVLAALQGLDLLARAALVDGARAGLGVEPSVRRLSVGLFSGTSTLRGLVVANPPGFSTPWLLRVERATADVGASALFSDVVGIGTLTLRGVDLKVEVGPGGVNVAEVLDHEPADGDGGPRLRVGTLVLERITIETEVRAGSLAPPLSRRLAIDRIELQELDDLSAGALLREVIRVLAERAGR